MSTQTTSSDASTVDDRDHDVFPISGMAYVQFAVSHPSHFRVMFSADTHAGPKRLPDEDADAFGLLVETLVDCHKARQVSRGDPMLLALSAWSMVHGLASLLVNKAAETIREGRDDEELARYVTQVLREGMRAPA